MEQPPPLTGVYVSDPKGVIGAYVSYKAHLCPKCGRVVYDEVWGVKQTPHLCTVLKPEKPEENHG